MKKCIKCCENKKESELNYSGICDSCKRKESDEEDNNRIMNIVMGDMFNTGIPGGVDLDISTPW